ncbi:MAG: hypothetical protein A2669_01865 [Candidatus Yanofskybacteria bacterium RIFCSPHIGHO2_01_FULL_48_25b]|uniref:Uncharacterized protein n=1 Tax=Candidatus Yanofskybacteria bacterium RIFCSPHIGHO2_01_FULL_48_25b TaxID=1802672 RepID=A0A1F8F2U2_9BACT|nr:MAG: hypothetical protein A2669_01865 [Candidatus Yanofskybacteria bacterium RIFCSPHIGHO2_01_FULL_48_25b]
MPGTVQDQYGNLELVGENVERFGLRKRVEYLFALDGSQMTGVILCELLDWLRWGSETSVMWNCTLQELITIIEKWLAANPDAALELFTPHFTEEVSWDKLWNERGLKGRMHRKRKCRCGTIFREFDDCHVCYERWHEMKEVYVGPQGEGTYDLVLNGAAGGSIAAAVWTCRGQRLTSPGDFERRNDLCLSMSLGD